MAVSWEVPRSTIKAVSTETKIWKSTKSRWDRSNSIKWPEIWFWYYSELRLYSDLRKKLFSLQLGSCITSLFLPLFTSLSALLNGLLCKVFFFHFSEDDLLPFTTDNPMYHYTILRKYTFYGVCVFHHYSIPKLFE